MLESKVKLCVETINKNFGTVKGYKTKYQNKYGFISAYFKAQTNRGIIQYPVILVPDENEDLEDYMVFYTFLKNTGLSDYFYRGSKLDIDSIVSILWFAEYERFKSSGKKAMHQDLSEYGYTKTIRDIIDEYIVPFKCLGNIRCIFNKETKGLVVISDEDNEYFDEAREFLGM